MTMHTTIPEILLRLPRNDDQKLIVPAEVADLSQPYNGSLTASDSTEIPIRRNIIELLGKNVGRTTIAQSSNFLGLTAKGYETVWRKRAISTISGEEHQLGDELNRLSEWLEPANGKRYLDLGCSTALYARQIAASAPASATIALDFSLPMLREARKMAATDGCSLYLLQANAEELPFPTAWFDGLACGGSLNEFYDPVKVLYEARRTLKSGGRFFLMYLLKANSIAGSLLQRTATLSGLHFWSEAESSSLFERTGFTVRRQERLGIVHFVLLEAT